MSWTRIAALALGATLLSCQPGVTDEAPASTLDEAYFRCHVQPVLTKSCAMFACHGATERPFRVFARNRLRYGIAGESKRNSPLNEKERHLNYESAVGFVDPASPDLSPIARKPLDANFAGFYHGATKLGTSNVFTSITDPDFETLWKWAHGEKEEDQKCVEPNSQ
jgi:hypothetical protein